MQTLKQVGALRRQVSRAIKTTSKGKTKRLEELQRIKTKIDVSLLKIQNIKPVRSCLPKKKQRELGLIPAVQ